MPFDKLVCLFHFPPRDLSLAIQVLLERNGSLNLWLNQLGQLGSHLSLLLSISSVGEVVFYATKSSMLTWQVLSPLPQNLSLFLTDGMLDSPVRQAGPLQILYLPMASIQFFTLSIPLFLIVLNWGRTGSPIPLDPLPTQRSSLLTLGCTGV